MNPSVVFYILLKFQAARDLLHRLLPSLLRANLQCTPMKVKKGFCVHGSIVLRFIVPFIATCFHDGSKFLFYLLYIGSST